MLMGTIIANVAEQGTRQCRGLGKWNWAHPERSRIEIHLLSTANKIFRGDLSSNLTDENVYSLKFIQNNSTANNSFLQFLESK